MKGLLVEKETGYYIVLTPMGAYKRINRSTQMNIGQEVRIDYAFSMIKIASLAAALLLIVLVGPMLGILGSSQVYAYVTLDINPSVEFAIDTEDIVLSANSFNPEAEQILAGIEYSGRSIDYVLADFTQVAIELQYITKDKENHVVVSFYPKHQDNSEFIEEKLNEITREQRKVLESSGQIAEFDTIIVDTESRKEAKKLGISSGKLKDSKNGRSENSNTTNKVDSKDTKEDVKENTKQEKEETKDITKQEKEETKEITKQEKEEEQKQEEKHNGVVEEVKEKEDKEVKEVKAVKEVKEEKEVKEVKEESIIKHHIEDKNFRTENKYK